MPVDDGMQCSSCKCWFHAPCTNLSRETYRLLGESSGVPWYCNNCSVSLEDVAGILMKRLNGLLPASSVGPNGLTVLPTTPTPVVSVASCSVQTTLKNRRKPKNKRKDSEKPTVGGSITDLVMSGVPTAPESQSGAEAWVEPKKPELNAQKLIKSKAAQPSVVTQTVAAGPMKPNAQKVGLDRTRNVILVNVPEPTGATAEVRLAEDIRSFGECVSLMLGDSSRGVHLRQLMRLGPRPVMDGGGKHRPIKAVLDSAEEVEFLLRSKHKLKGKPYYVLKDMSVDERQKLKEARAELLRRKSAGETNLRIVDFRIVAVNPPLWKEPIWVPGNPSPLKGVDS